jgi:hypothetical protein
MEHIVYVPKQFPEVTETEQNDVGPYTLKVAFDDGLCREIDFQPFLQGELYGPLRDLRLFEQVRLDAEVHTLIWPNGADFDLATLHDWPLKDDEVAGAVEHWPEPSEAAGRR